MRTFTINIKIIERKVSPWNNFLGVSDEHWILRATFSQNDSQFPPAHRNNQDVPNCLMALIFAKLCTENDWNSTALDVLLKFGDRLFKKSLARLSSVSSSMLKLGLNQMDLPVFLRPFIINVSHELIKRDMMIKPNDNSPLENLKKLIGSFLKSSNVGILAAKKYYVALWRFGDALMMFDPHDIGPDGVRKSTGFACMQRFLSHINLVDIFWENVKDLEGN